MQVHVENEEIWALAFYIYRINKTKCHKCPFQKLGVTQSAYTRCRDFAFKQNFFTHVLVNGIGQNLRCQVERCS